MARAKRIGNPVLDSTIYALRQARRVSGAKVWKAVIDELLKPRSRRREVNVGEIARVTEEGDLVVVPGKVLGGGDISHRLVIGAFSYSNKALRKLLDAGCEALSLKEFADKYPKRKGVKLIG